MNRAALEGIIDGADSVTAIAKSMMRNTSDARIKQIVDALIEHSHAFLREVRLTDQEFEQGLDFLRAVGQACNDKHNEVVLLSDVLGISTLATLLNHTGDAGRTPAALLGPFYRDGAPECANGANIASLDSPGNALFFKGRVLNTDGTPVARARVDVWQASPVGLYENQDPEQPEMNLRGRFHTDASGGFHFRSVRPAGYPVPTHGPVGRMLEIQQRHPYRPAHLHFVVIAEGHETLITQVFADDSEHLASDVAFGVTRDLVGHFERHDDAASPEPVEGPYYTLDYDFVLVEGTPTYPLPPIK